MSESEEPFFGEIAGFDVSKKLPLIERAGLIFPSGWIKRWVSEGASTVQPSVSAFIGDFIRQADLPFIVSKGVEYIAHNPQLLVDSLTIAGISISGLVGWIYKHFKDHDEMISQERHQLNPSFLEVRNQQGILIG